jgi:hypothetical protein
VTAARDRPALRDRESGTDSRGLDRRSAGRRIEDRSRLLGPRLVALFLAGCVLFGYPILGLFSRPERIAGIPLLFVYVFVAWGAFIAALAWLVDPGERGR